MAQDNWTDGGSTSRLGGIVEALRSRDTWRVSSRYVLFVVSTLVTLSVLAAAIPTMLGMDSFIIDGGSMRPAVPGGALVIASRVDPASVTAGQIITFRHSTSPQTPVTHRVVKVLRESNGMVNLLTKGDANSTADPEPVATDLPVSRMVISVPFAGYVLEFSRTSAGKVALIAAPALLLLLSIRRRSDSSDSSDEVVAEAVASKKGPITMVAATHVSSMPAGGAGRSDTALERLAQRTTPAPAAPVTPARRPGLGRRLIAALRNDVPEVAAAPVAAPVATRFAPPLPARMVTSTPRPVAVPAPRAAASVETILEGSMAPDGTPSLLHLARLRLRSVSRLAEITRTFDLVEAEASPLLNLVADLDTVHDRFSANLDEAMRPLTEFADRWDDDLIALAERMQSDAPLPQMDIAAERRRIAEIRAQIPHRHSLLVEQFEVEKHAIDAALTVFDDQVARLEAQLTAARHTAEAIGDSMRTADFGRTVEFLRRRMEQLAVLAERGAATPDEIAEALPVAAALAADDEETLTSSPYLHAVLAVLDREGLAHAAPRAGRGAA